MDFRSYLGVLEQAGDLVRIREPLAVEYDIGALCRQLADDDGPAALVQSVEGHSVPLAVNVYGTRARVARALGVSEAEMLQHVAGRLKKPPPDRAVQGRGGSLPGGRVDRA